MSVDLVRPAVLEDLPAIVSMAVRFGASETFAGGLPVDPEKVGAVAQAAMASEDKTVFVGVHGGRVVGMLALYVYEHPFTTQRVATELVWWVDQDMRGGRLGLRLLAAAEAWAKDVGADVVQMVAPNDAVASVYARRGYDLLERAYQRRV
jgi:GNAT superfamily N-acetyltransferase